MTADLLAALILILAGPAWTCTAYIQFQNTRRFHTMNLQGHTFWRPTAEDEKLRIENENRLYSDKWDEVRRRLAPEQIAELEKLPSFRERIDAGVTMSPRRRQPAHHGAMVSASIGGNVSEW